DLPEALLIALPDSDRDRCGSGGRDVDADPYDVAGERARAHCSVAGRRQNGRLTVRFRQREYAARRGIHRRHQLVLSVHPRNTALAATLDLSQLCRGLGDRGTEEETSESPSSSQRDPFPIFETTQKNNPPFPAEIGFIVSPPPPPQESPPPRHAD